MILEVKYHMAFLKLNINKFILISKEIPIVNYYVLITKLYFLYMFFIHV